MVQRWPVSITSETLISFSSTSCFRRFCVQRQPRLLLLSMVKYSVGIVMSRSWLRDVVELGRRLDHVGAEPASSCVAGPACMG
jgi:hypothetical protein